MPSKTLAGMTAFMEINVKRFPGRFMLSYHRKDACIEYFIHHAMDISIIRLRTFNEEDIPFLFE